MIPIKTAAQIEKMRIACRAAARVLEKTAACVRPGVTTREIDQAAARFLREEESESAFLGYRGFPGNICISINEEVVHGIGGERKIQYGDLVKLDVGVLKNGWVGDTATTLSIGPIAPELTQLLAATEEALRLAIQQARHGKRIGDLGANVEAHILLNGFNVVREFVGHGVGRKLHEEPQIPNFGRAGSGPKLKAGMTLAIEPMVNLGGSSVKVLSDGWTVVTLDGKPSAHFEHTVLVTHGEPEILTCRKETPSK